ncbi:methionine synthase [Geitlerinema sp. CS-897]|nr:methionine synthase [Geitlerinema sp. CS-897]
MTRGIYIVANDKVYEQTIALLKSIRHRDTETPIVMIPFDDNHQKVAEIVTKEYGVQLYEDLEFVETLCQQLHEIFGKDFFNNPNKQRKQACWFGPFDEFLYIDVDIVVFEKIIDNLKYFDKYDFLCCDYQYTNSIANVFTPKVLEEGVFTEDDLKDVFNSGWWASKKNLFSVQDLYDTFTECAQHPDYFDFSQKTTDQPIFNYLVLKRISRRFNVVRRPGGAPGSWAGSPHFEQKGDRLFDPKTGQPLQYLHWAGVRIEPGCPYWEIWQHYRYLGEPIPDRPAIAPPPKSWTRQAIDRVKSVLRKFKP